MAGDPKRKPIFDVDQIANQVARSFGDSIRGSMLAYLGDPISKLVEVPLDQADHAGTYYIHGISAENLAITGEESQTTDDKQFITTASMTPNKISPGLLLYGTPVYIKRSGSDWVIVDLAGVAASEYLYGVKERLQRSVDVSQIDYGLIRPSNPQSFRVIVSGARYYLNGIAYDVPTLTSSDFQSEVPGSIGQAKACRLLLNPITEVLSYQWSSQFANNVQHSICFPNYPNTAETSLFSCGWVKVYNGMVSIGIDDIYAGQEYLNKQEQLPPEPSQLFPKILVIAGEVVTDDDGEVMWIEED